MSAAQWQQLGLMIAASVAAALIVDWIQDQYIKPAREGAGASGSW